MRWDEAVNGPPARNTARTRATERVSVSPSKAGTAAEATGSDTERRFITARKSLIGSDRTRIALSCSCYRRRKTLALQGPRKLPKLDVAGSTQVARSVSSGS